MEGRLKNLNDSCQSAARAPTAAAHPSASPAPMTPYFKVYMNLKKPCAPCEMNKGQLVDQNKTLRQRFTEIDAINDRLRNQLTFLRDADGDAERLRQERVENQAFNGRAQRAFNQI